LVHNILLTFYKKLGMTPQFTEFYRNWLCKADSYQSYELKDYFDKFITLYIIFNFLYMEVWNKCNNNESTNGKRFYEKKAATDEVIKYLGARFFINQLLNDNDCENSLSSLPTIISDFNIVLKWGKPQVFRDVQLWESINETTNVNKRAVAILALFYKVRCNLFHGHKGFDEDQRRLLAPINILLRKTVEITYKKLERDL